MDKITASSVGVRLQGCKPLCALARVGQLGGCEHFRSLVASLRGPLPY